MSYEVSNEQLCKRLREMCTAVTKSRDAMLREFVIRIPAEPARDADLILIESANRIAELEAEVAGLRMLSELDSSTDLAAEILRLRAENERLKAEVREWRDWDAWDADTEDMPTPTWCKKIVELEAENEQLREENSKRFGAVEAAAQENERLKAENEKCEQRYLMAVKGRQDFRHAMKEARDQLTIARAALENIIKHQAGVCDGAVALGWSTTARIAREALDQIDEIANN